VREGTVARVGEELVHELLGRLSAKADEARFCTPGHSRYELLLEATLLVGQLKTWLSDEAPGAVAAGAEAMLRSRAHVCVGDAVLPTGKRLNPRNPQDAELYDPAQVAYVVFEIKQGWMRVFTGLSGLDEAWALGCTHIVRHEQSDRRLGVFRVIGYHVFATGEMRGDVPDSTLSHWVLR
jgi:hypothetical protein